MDERGKEPEALRTIREVADALGLEAHVLRFWETQFKQIKPLKMRGGRRYYRPADIDALRRIHHLLHVEKYTIKGARSALAGKAPGQESLPALFKPETYRPEMVESGPKSLTLPAERTREALQHLRERLAQAQAQLQSALESA